MENRIVFKNREIVKQDSNFLGIAGENEQEIIAFSFEDGFIDGACFLELELPDGKNHLIRLEKNNECYQLIVKKSLLKLSGIMKMQLKLISNVTEIWKSLIFEMPILKAINVTENITDDYPDLLVMMQEMEVGLEQINERTKDLKNYDDSQLKRIVKELDENKVNTEDGKGLSSNDFTNEAKNQIETNKTDIATHQTKITALETDNTKNKSDITKAKSDISTLQTDKADKSEIPTKVSQLVDDKGLATETFVKNKIDEIDKSTDSITTLDGKTLSTVLTELIASIDSKATAKDINDRINELVNGAPETFDTLKEIADYIAEHEEIASALNEAIGNKVDKEDGKSLMSDTEIERLSGVDNYNDAEIKQDILDIQSEQVTQNETIAEIQQKDVTQDGSIELLTQENIEIKQENTELKAECERLREDANSAPCVSSEGENVTLEGTLEARFKEFKICGNSKQEVREGYNLLFNRQAEKLTINGIEFSIHENGTVNVNGTATANAILNLLDSKTLDLAEGSYFLSGCPVGGSTSKYKFDMIEGMVGNPIAEDYGNGATLTLTESKSIQQARIVIYGGATVNNLLFKPMICVEQKTYEQYGASPSVDFPSEIKTVKDSADVTICNKNLLNTKLAKNKVANGVTFTVNEDGSISIKGTAEKYVTLFIEHKMTLKANQTYKAVAFGNKNIASSLYFITTDNKYMGVNLKKDSVFDKDIEIAKFYIAVNEGVTIDEIVYLMLCNDTTDSDYIEHKEQSFTIDVQQEMLKDDYLDFETQEEVHEWRKIVLDGVNYGAGYVFPSGWFTIQDLVNNKAVNDGIEQPQWGHKTDKILCTHLKASGQWHIQMNNESGIAYCGEQGGVSLKLDNATEETNTWTKETINQYLQEHNIVVYYKLAEPLRLEMTTEQKAVAKQIRNAKSYKGVTHIFSTDEISPIIRVEAKKDMQAEIDKVNSKINELQAMILAE